MRTKDTCEWKYDTDGYWIAACGHKWTFNDGTPYENGMNYCCYCGKKLIERKFNVPLSPIEKGWK